MKMFLPILFACLTALCWGLYGPALQNARSPTNEWSPFKPYVFTGIAYLVWAVLGGLAGMAFKQDNFNFTGPQSAAMTWGFLAGSVGAFGALFLTSAMISGGKPLFVMPIVFGGAVTVTAIFSVIHLRLYSHANPMLWVGMVMVFIGVILVAKNTPHGAPPKAGKALPTHTSTPASETLESNKPISS